MNHTQTIASSDGIPQTLSGLISDAKCNSAHPWGDSEESDNQSRTCAQRCVRDGSGYVLIVEKTVYQLHGENALLGKFAGLKAAVHGVLQKNTMLVESIDYAEVPEQVIEELINELPSHSGKCPENVMVPTYWIYYMTEPMIRIIEIGPAAEPVLLKHLADENVKGQIIILLGGVGGENSVEPIIDAMVSDPDDSRFACINLAANLALTNITVSDVIWHHGGGLIHDACPKDPKACWSRWWQANQADFKVKNIKPDFRRYTNYPNYGICSAR